MIVVYWWAMDSHFKREVLEIFNMNVKNIIAWICFLNLTPICQLLKIHRRKMVSYHVTYYFKIFRTISPLFVPNFDSAPFSMPKL